MFDLVDQNSDFQSGPMMSSKDIARLTGKLHKNVLRDIRVLMAQLYDFLEPPKSPHSLEISSEDWLDVEPADSAAENQWVTYIPEDQDLEPLERPFRFDGQYEGVPWMSVETDAKGRTMAISLDQEHAYVLVGKYDVKAIQAFVRYSLKVNEALMQKVLSAEPLALSRSLVYPGDTINLPLYEFLPPVSPHKNPNPRQARVFMATDLYRELKIRERYEQLDQAERTKNAGLFTLHKWWHKYVTKTIMFMHLQESDWWSINGDYLCRPWVAKALADRFKEWDLASFIERKSGRIGYPIPIKLVNDRHGLPNVEVLQEPFPQTNFTQPQLQAPEEDY